MEIGRVFQRLPVPNCQGSYQTRTLSCGLGRLPVRRQDAKWQEMTQEMTNDSNDSCRRQEVFEKLQPYLDAKRTCVGTIFAQGRT